MLFYRYPVYLLSLSLIRRDAPSVGRNLILTHWKDLLMSWTSTFLALQAHVGYIVTSFVFLKLNSTPFPPLTLYSFLFNKGAGATSNISLKSLLCIPTQTIRCVGFTNLNNCNIHFAQYFPRLSRSGGMKSSTLHIITAPISSQQTSFWTRNIRCSRNQKEIVI